MLDGFSSCRIEVVLMSSLLPLVHFFICLDHVVVLGCNMGIPCISTKACCCSMYTAGIAGGVGFLVLLAIFFAPRAPRSYHYTV